MNDRQRRTGRHGAVTGRNAHVGKGRRRATSPKPPLPIGWIIAGSVILVVLAICVVANVKDPGIQQAQPGGPASTQSSPDSVANARDAALQAEIELPFDISAVSPQDVVDMSNMLDQMATGLGKSTSRLSKKQRRALVYVLVSVYAHGGSATVNENYGKLMATFMRMPDSAEWVCQTRFASPEGRAARQRLTGPEASAVIGVWGAYSRANDNCAKRGTTIDALIDLQYP